MAGDYCIGGLVIFIYLLITIGRDFAWELWWGTLGREKDLMPSLLNNQD
ncbi:MAG TPA: hypothetical protein VHD35_10720 [Chitinophagaceae bacterium]|jgi:hypothetical protein|nr:hypothetical protein [Chitinophagaceae bacterium]